MIPLMMIANLAGATDLAVKGREIHPVSGPVLRDGVVLIADGRIEAIGQASNVNVPEGVPTVEAAFVTPGLVDGLTTVGLTGIYNHGPDQDHREGAAPVQPHLRAVDGFNPWEPLVAWVREHGVTMMQIGPSPGPVVAGRTAVVGTMPTTSGADTVQADAMVLFSLGELPKQGFGDQGAQTRMGSAAHVRQALAKAAEYAKRRRLSLSDRPAVDLGQQALAEVIEGKRKAVFHANRADDLLTALRIAEEYDIRIVLAGAAEAYLVRDAIAEAQVPVLVGPVMVRGWRDGVEQSNASFRNAALLAEDGILVGLMTGYEGYVPKVRVILWEAAIAASHGMGLPAALRAITLGNATVLGVQREVGSLAVGKRADLALFDGDPFEYTTHVCGVIVAGEMVSDKCR